MNLVFDVNGTPYLAYSDGGNSYKATVQKYDGTNWIAVGNAGFTVDEVGYTSLAIDGNGTPYVAFEDWDNFKFATVMKYNGTGWVIVGSAGFSAGTAQHVNMAIDANGTPYVAYEDGSNSDKATVMKYNGANWVAVGSAGFSASSIDDISLAIDGNGTPYVAFVDFANSNKATVMKYNGTNWTAVGSAGFSSGAAHNIRLAIDGSGAAYVVFSDGNNNNKATAMKYTGTSWVTVGSAGFSAGGIDNTSIAIDAGGTPYVAYQDGGNSSKATLMKYDGTTWVTVGTAGFSAGIAAYTSLALDKNDIPYVAYADGANNNKATVMKYDCLNTTPAQLCGVLTDATTGNNVIAWNTAGIQHADSYRVYRENGGNYQPVGTVSASAAAMYTDATATPNTQSYKYKVTVMDSCGTETSLDSCTVHETVRLSFDQRKGNEAYLSWNAYTGIASPSYMVMRSVDGGVYTSLATVATTSYTDMNVPATGNVTYRIDMTAPACLSGLGYSSITSNVANAWAATINGIENTNNISIVPNPAQDNVTISFKKATQVNIISLTGQVVHTENLMPDDSSTIVSVGEFPAGVYMVQILANGQKHTARLVVQ
ncbi:MAG: T9SS type A sorting domain-containing protein [Chitinophagales bacterium]|nr:T9SS type A sorting domain-containing protein [Chitinophagales bacterium]